MALDIINLFSRIFDSLADAWLSAGAAGLSLWDEKQCVRSWGEAAQTTLSAPIMLRRRRIGELRIAIHDTPAHRARLTADVAMIAQLHETHVGIEAITGELINVQDQLAALSQIGRQMGQVIRIEAALPLLAREAATLLKSEAATIILSGADGAATSIRPDGSAGPVLPAAIVRKLLFSGSEQICHAEESDLAQYGIDEALAVPVPIRGTVLAGMVVALNRRAGRFSSPDLKLARAIADQAGAAIDRGMLYQEQLAFVQVEAEMNLARSVQDRLLPSRLPIQPGLELFGRTRPSRQIGGDFFDIMQSEDRSLTFMVGDVTGKGVPAALLAAMLRTSLRSKASFMPQPSPMRIVERANEDLYTDFTEVDMFATLVVGQYDADRRMLHLANAGHAPVLYRPAGGCARLIEADGVPVGVLPSAICEGVSLPFSPGDLLLIASDGFHEAEDPAGQMFGIERIIELIDQSHDQSVHTFGPALFAEVEQFTQTNELSDDRTLLIVQAVAS